MDAFREQYPKPSRARASVLLTPRLRHFPDTLPNGACGKTCFDPVFSGIARPHLLRIFGRQSAQELHSLARQQPTLGVGPACENERGVMLVAEQRAVASDDPVAYGAFGHRAGRSIGPHFTTCEPQALHRKSRCTAPISRLLLAFDRAMLSARLSSTAARPQPWQTTRRLNPWRE